MTRSTVKKFDKTVLVAARRKGRPFGICGAFVPIYQAPIVCIARENHPAIRGKRRNLSRNLYEKLPVSRSGADEPTSVSMDTRQ